MSVRDVVDLAEQLAKALHLDSGNQKLELQFADGHLRRGDVHRGPLKPDELREIAGP